MAGRPRQFEAEGSTEAGTELLQAVEEIFGSRCKAAWLSGSFAYQGARPARSDIDVVVVLDDPVSVPADEETIGLIHRFVDAYLAIHARHGFDPDLEFPGEYVTPGMVEETIRWRGLAYGGGVAASFPPVVSADYWLDRPDRWYNAWLSMTAFSRFPIGSGDYHEAVKLAAWKTIASFVLLRAGRRLLSPDDMLLGLGQFGVKPRYPAFWEEEREWVGRALQELQAEGAIYLAGGLIEPNMEHLCDWERVVCAAIEAGVEPPPLLLDRPLHRGIEEHAESRWSALTGERV